MTSLSLFTFLHWRRKWQPTSVLLPRESQGRGSLMGCHLWGCIESTCLRTVHTRICLPYGLTRRRRWQPTPVLLPGKLHGRRSLVGCSPWGHEESDTTVASLSLFTFMHWRRKWQPTPVFLPRESQGRGSLVDCRLWGRTESETTEVT